MAVTVISPQEIILNSVRFPISGFVQEGAIDRFPEKMLIGVPDYENEQLLSNWVISDFRGGMLVEEMDEAVHKDRYYWSTCDTRFRNNLMLGPLAFAGTLPTSLTPTIVNADMELTTGWTGGARDSGEAHGGTYSWAIFPDSTEAYQDITWNAAYAGKKFIFRCWVKAVLGGSNISIKINDGIGETSSANSGTGAWEQLTVSRQLSSSATRLRLILRSGDGSGDYYFDDATLPMTYPTLEYARYYIEFNSNLYIADGNGLLKLNAGGTGFDVVAGFSANITALIQNGTNLFILLNTNAYWYMDTSEAFTEATPTGAVTLGNKGIWWDDKLFQFNTTGSNKYSASPAAASPAYTANGKLPIATNELQELTTYFDANGNDVIYCSTKVGLFSHDFTNAKFLHTALKVPPHPTAGKGAVIWHDGCFISAGLNVSKYIAESTATIEDVGLAKDDGLPQYRNGEVVKFIEGYSEFFALIDSTYEGATSRSQVVSYDGQGWRTWWEADADNKNMYGGIVSSVYAYRLWFSTTDGVYYIRLQRHTVNPKKQTYYYQDSGVHITPRFDAGSKAFRKLATKLTLFLDDLTADQTVAVTYQIDQAQGALGSAWTALVSAQTADGVKEQTFGTNGVGVLFYDIQFRLALAAAAPGAYSPVVKGMVLSYLKILGRKRSWSFTINTAEAGRVSSTPKALTDAIATILTTNTLMLFTFRDGAGATDTKYCLVQPFSGEVPTGQNWQSLWNFTCIEV